MRKNARRVDAEYDFKGVLGEGSFGKVHQVRLTSVSYYFVCRIIRNISESILIGSYTLYHLMH